MSGRESLLDEAIAKAKEAGDWQLAEWLRTARGSESAAMWYTDRLRDTNRTIRKLLDENAKLRELVKAFWWCTENFDMPSKCDGCPLGQSDKLTPECEVRMRELEIQSGEATE